jgi:hypothetical protein
MRLFDLHEVIIASSGLLRTRIAIIGVLHLVPPPPAELFVAVIESQVELSVYVILRAFKVIKHGRGKLPFVSTMTYINFLSYKKKNKNQIRFDTDEHGEYQPGINRLQANIPG